MLGSYILWLDDISFMFCKVDYRGGLFFGQLSKFGRGFFRRILL